MSPSRGPIPIKNIFYMLCYAWNVLAVTDDFDFSSDDYDDANNLLARVFSFGIGKLIRSGFHRSYVEHEEELSTLRGKILVKDSISKQSQQRKKLVCSYDDYSKNDLFNQILKYTIHSLLTNTSVDADTKKLLKKQAVFFDGVDETAPTKDARRRLIYNRNNVTYKLLVNIAIMLYENTSIDEESGQTRFKDFSRDKQMEKVFELFILNFYKMHLKKSTYKVHAPKINWHMEETAEEIYGDLFAVDMNPGDRRTDIVIENKELNLQMILDAKYYSRTFVNAYRGDSDRRIRTSHLNQIRGYVEDSEFNGEKIGALVYPMVENDLSAGRLHPIEGTPIIIKTIDLNAEWRDIEKDLLDFLKKMQELGIRRI